MPAYEVFIWTPDYSYTEDIEFATELTSFESGVEQRRRRRIAGLRTFNLTYKLLDLNEVDEIWDFFIARSGRFGAFLYRNYPNDYRIAQETPSGVVDGTNNTFALVKTYIINTGDGVFSPVAVDPLVYVNGVLKTELVHYTINYSTGVITFTAGNIPGIGDLVRVTYEFYYKVRFSEDKFSRELFEHILYQTGLKIKQLLI